MRLYLINEGPECINGRLGTSIINGDLICPEGVEEEGLALDLTSPTLSREERTLGTK